MKFGYLNQEDIDLLRSVFDEIVMENGIPVDSQEYVRLANAVIDLYLSGTFEADDLKRMVNSARAA